MRRPASGQEVAEVVAHLVQVLFGGVDAAQRSIARAEQACEHVLALGVQYRQTLRVFVVPLLFMEMARMVTRLSDTMLAPRG